MKETTVPERPPVYPAKTEPLDGGNPPEPEPPEPDDAEGRGVAIAEP